MTVTLPATTPQIELRPYQEDICNKVYAQFKQYLAFLSRHTQEEIANCEELQRQLKSLQTALVVLPTGGGKTIIFSSVEIQVRRLLELAGSALNTLIIAHRQELLQQARDKYHMIAPDMIIGMVGNGIAEYGAPVTVASIATISRKEHLTALKSFGYQLVIVDECFPAGTLIDGHPIEQIKTGDVVTAFDEVTGTYAQKKVVRTFRNPIKNHLLKITSDGYSVVCTPNHPFYTSSGWKTAQDLALGEVILHARNSSDMQPMPPAVYPHHENTTKQLLRKEKRLLPPGMQQSILLPNIIKNYGRNEQEICFSTDESKQSNEKTGIAVKDAINHPRYGAFPAHTRRQWGRSNNTTTNVSGTPELADGICNKNQSPTQTTPSLSNTLQNGYSQPGTHDSYRSGWGFTPDINPESPRSQENRFSYWARVDSIEVYKSGSDGTFGGLCTDGHVYNFEVEDYHTYTANGFVVHNCHHVAAKGYQKVLKELPNAFRLYVTATPDRLDGKPVIDHAPTCSCSIIDMISQGYLSNLTPIAIRTETRLEKIDKTAGDFNSKQLAETVDNPKRNTRIAEAYQEHCAGRQFLCFSVTVQHAYNLAQAFQEIGVRTEVVSGKTPSEERARLLKDYEDGQITGLINCGILVEGYDDPGTSCVIMARPTQSRALFTQMIGRGLRLAPGKKDCVLLDITDNIFNHKLQPPVNLSTILNKRIGNKESVLDALEREEREEEKRKEKEASETQDRIIRQKRREKDAVVNLLEKFEWERKPEGHYVLEVGPHKHRIGLIPDKMQAGLWLVCAKLAPKYELQWWSQTPMGLDWAQQFAEREARKLAGEPGAVKLLDRNADWRYDPASPAQIEKLKKFRIPYPQDVQGRCMWTKGQATDAMNAKFKQWERQREAKKKAI